LIYRSAITRYAVSRDIGRNYVDDEVSRNSSGNKNALYVVGNVCRASWDGKSAGEYVAFISIASNGNLEVEVIDESVT